MAQLPPKIPNMTPFPSMTPDWSSPFHHPRVPSMGNLTQNSPSSQPSWVDEFLDFSTAKRNAHRRSVSDSITFLEAPTLVEECQSSSSLRPSGGRHNNEFDKLDDEQLMSMFSDDISGENFIKPPPPQQQQNIWSSNPSSNPSTSSDQNSNNNDEKATQCDQKIKNESGEVQSSRNLPPPSSTSNGDHHAVDPKRVRRILANRQSAQRSRVRKLQYISELERSVTSLQTEVSTLSPKVAFLDHQRVALNVDNSAIKQRLAALAQDKIFKDAHQEALKKEIERLRQVYHQQNLKKISETLIDHPKKEEEEEEEDCKDKCSFSNESNHE